MSGFEEELRHHEIRPGEDLFGEVLRIEFEIALGFGMTLGVSGDANGEMPWRAAVDKFDEIPRMLEVRIVDRGLAFRERGGRIARQRKNMTDSRALQLVDDPAEFSFVREYRR